MSISSPLGLPRKLRINRERIEVSFYREQLSESIEIQMMQIPAGQFEMGSPGHELGRSDSEEPQHTVNISEFWMSKYPITQEQWAIVAEYPGGDLNLNTHPTQKTKPKYPVEQVSWHEAVEFCQRLSSHTNRYYRLPSEAEWEYACRAGTTTPFHFGETITTDLANYRGTDDEDYGRSGSYGEGPKGIYREETTPVGQFEVTNTFGLSDMHGNVWEWCEDVWHDNYDGAPTDGSAWVEGGNSNRRIVRGGSWGYNPENCRSASRGSDNPVNGGSRIGFRVVCAVRGTP